MWCSLRLPSYPFELANTSAGNSQVQTQFQLAESARWGYRNLDPHPIPNQFRSSTQPRDLTTCFSTTTSNKWTVKSQPLVHTALIIRCQENPQPPPPFCSTVDGRLPATDNRLEHRPGLLRGQHPGSQPREPRPRLVPAALTAHREFRNRVSARRLGCCCCSKIRT